MDSDSPSRKWKIDHMGRVDRTSFLAILFTFMTVPSVACSLRIIFRTGTKRLFKWDDGFVVIATVFLITATACYYRLTDAFYLIEAKTTTPDFDLSLAETQKISGNGPTILLNFARCLLTAASFSIKASFLAVFRPLVRHVSLPLEYYFIFSVIYIPICFTFRVSLAFIICRGNLADQYQCLRTQQYLYLGLLCFFDISTDIVVVSIPIFILRLANLDMYQGLRIGFFLCLSSAMIIIAAVRTSSSLVHVVNGKQEASIIYTTLLIQIESGVAVLMGSISALRTVFTGAQRDDNGRAQSIYRKVLVKLSLSKGSEVSTHDAEHAVRMSTHKNSLVTMTSSRSWKDLFGRSDRESGQGTDNSTSNAQLDTLTEYHAFVYATPQNKTQSPSE
ncbi:unnamed protein product [Periconia digitata]|uniref:Rhodopsin domain-containing protein n=1 Tax=Periconia digitata TaxID=1303443 RepID=A0A9W4UI86_9PLEO|nr:unnamed protein product [Periconia digitata]